MTLDKVRYELASPRRSRPQSSRSGYLGSQERCDASRSDTNDYHFDTFAPKLKYDALKDTTKDQGWGQGFIKGLTSPALRAQCTSFEKGTGSPSWL